jgi:hypothetical protein
VGFGLRLGQNGGDGAPLGLGHDAGDRRRGRAEQVAQPGERERRLDLRRPGAQDLEAQLLSPLDPASHGVVLPIPASPSSTSARNGPFSRNRSISSNSASRPITSTRPLTIASRRPPSAG